MSHSHPSSDAVTQSRMERRDWLVLTKARLSGMVAITTFFGYWVGTRAPGGVFEWSRLLHTVFGTLLCAFGSAVFNQLMEAEPDAKMKRTADRPVPAGRLNPGVAFIVGALLSAWGLIHLNATANFEACAFAAITLVVYIFVYTPMKQRSSWNTVVGAVSGALPPLIGWAAAFPSLSPSAPIRWELVTAPQAFFLFGLLFLWQMPHFLAINWMYREEYIRGGFVMWANTDDDGSKTARLAIFFSILQVLLMLQPQWSGFATWVFSLGGLILSGAILFLAFQFNRDRQRESARKLFFATLMHLPLLLGLLVLGLKK